MGEMAEWLKAAVC